ncbi:DGPFAETKE family protein [Rhizobium freirei PRF 81]|uniref:DGPFAETKE family protein n=1 Tax=Rhizobium freirei PRF 81 TaxID=363754 RepID=N6TY21_9HYPH|nr:YciI family protein [Rhizobium freirei]ENN85314.1 DGPFAETKE family protein [Rhizobium freirei PRF 81]
MKYMALIYSAPDSSPNFGTPEFGSLMSAYQAVTERFAKDGVLVAGDALEAPSTATTVSVRNGRTETLDGPFAESKEQLGGFYIFDCANLDDAIRYAAMIPTATYGRVEVRPIRNLANML